MSHEVYVGIVCFLNAMIVAVIRYFWSLRASDTKDADRASK